QGHRRAGQVDRPGPRRGPQGPGPRRRAGHQGPPRPAREARPPDGRDGRQRQHHRPPRHRRRPREAAPERHDQHQRRTGPRRCRPPGPPAAARLRRRGGRMRPSPLYERLGLTGPADELLDLVIAGQPVHAYSVRINRGGTDLSSYTASTITVETPANVPPAASGQDLEVTLNTDAAALIAARVYQPLEE